MTVSGEGAGGDGDAWPALAVVRLASNELRAQIPHLSGEEASDLLRRVTTAAADLDALRLALVGRVEESEVWRQDANGTANSWLRSQHTLDHRSAQADLRAARALRNYPALREAAESGALTRAHIDAILAIGEANEVRRRALGDFMHIFVGVGRRQPVSVLKAVMRAWADQVDPVGMARDEDEAHQRRFLHVNLLADGVHVEGFFAKAEGAKVIAALNAALTKSRRAVTGGDERPAWAPPGDNESHGDDATDGPVGAGTPRSRDALAPDLPELSTAQQRADAFIAGVIDPVLEGAGLPTVGGSRPAVTVLVPLERLERPCQAGAPEASVDGTLPFVDASAAIGVTNGPGTMPISAISVQRLTCDCEVHRVLIDPQGLPLDVGRTMRTIPPHIRKALVVRDKGCVFPGCDRPPGWSEAHHIVHWSQGGKTSLDNSVLLCSKHHHKVHAEGHEVVVGPDGRGRVLVKSTRIRQ